MVFQGIWFGTNEVDPLAVQPIRAETSFLTKIGERDGGAGQDALPHHPKSDFKRYLKVEMASQYTKLADILAKCRGGGRHHRAPSISRYVDNPGVGEIH